MSDSGESLRGVNAPLVQDAVDAEGCGAESLMLDGAGRVGRSLLKNSDTNLLLNN